MGTNTDLYGRDFSDWSQATAIMIRHGKRHATAPEAAAEEVESLGTRETHALESRLEVLVRHFLKWCYQPERRVRSQNQRSTVLEQRRRLTGLQQDSPNLRSALDATLQDEYSHARQRAIAETRFPASTVPGTSRWIPSRPIDTDF
jgi:exonuclease VII large subunit